MPDPGPVHLGADEVTFRLLFRLLGQALAVAEADLQRHRRRAPEHRRQIQRRGGLRELQAEARQQFVQRALLARRQPALAAHEAADAPVERPVVGSGIDRFVHFQLKNRPVCGEEAEA